MIPFTLGTCPECGELTIDDPERCSECDEPLRLPDQCPLPRRAWDLLLIALAVGFVLAAISLFIQGTGGMNAGNF